MAKPELPPELPPPDEWPNPMLVLHDLAQHQWIWWFVGSMWLVVLLAIVYCGLKPEGEEDEGAAKEKSS